MKQFLIFLFTTILLYACNGSDTVQTQNPSYPNNTSYPNASTYPNESLPDNPGSRPYAPQPGDATLTRGEVAFDSTNLLILESFPVQIMLELKGSLPTPCHSLRVVHNLLEDQNRIEVEVYSVSDPNQMCVQVLEPFEANVGLGSFPTGHYTVWVNGEMIGEFDA